MGSTITVRPKGRDGLIMKWVFLFLACFLLVVTAAYGETMYVTDVIEIMVRTGPELKHKIIAMPKSGTPVEVLEVVDDWSRVKLPRDREGWLLTQFLVPGPPSKTLIAQLRRQNEALTRRTDILAEENARLKTERKELEKTLSEQTGTAKALGKSYETLRSESKNFLALKASYEKATQELAAKTKQVAELEKELKALRNSQALHWFLGGAGVIFVGFIIGFLSRRSRRRPPLL